MFEKSVDDRLSSWVQLRQNLETSIAPFEETWEFWKHAPFIPYNRRIDPYYERNWPSPWEIIVENKYDDFTKALMIGWTIKLTKRFKNDKIELRTLLDKARPSQYNVVYINDQWAINYSDNGPILKDNIPESFLLENLIEVKAPR